MARFPNLRIISNMKRALFHNLARARVDGATSSYVQSRYANTGSLSHRSQEGMIVHSLEESRVGGFFELQTGKACFPIDFCCGMWECVKDSILSYSMDIFCCGKSLLPRRYRNSKAVASSIFLLVSFGYRARPAIVQNRRLWPFRCTPRNLARSREQLLFRLRVLTRTSAKLSSGGS